MSVSELPGAEPGGGDDYSHTTSTSAVAIVGEPFTGYIESSYSENGDMIAIELQAGQPYYITLSGVTAGGGNLYQPWIVSVY